MNLVERTWNDCSQLSDYNFADLSVQNTVAHAPIRFEEIVISPNLVYCYCTQMSMEVYLWQNSILSNRYQILQIVYESI